MELSLADYIQIAGFGATAVILGAGLINRWAVANHKDRLAAVTSAAGNAAGRIRSDLNALPPGADLAAVERQLISNEAPVLAAEFGPQLAKIGGDVPKVEALIKGQLGQIPSATAPLVAGTATLEPMVGQALVPAAADLSHAAVAAVADAVVGRLTMATTAVKLGQAA